MREVNSFGPLFGLAMCVNKGIHLDFWAPFFGSFFGRAKNEQ
jgi:hypothetical protein